MRQQFRQMIEQLGWQGIFGVALLVLSGAFNLWVLQPLDQDVSVMHSQVDMALDRANGRSRPFSMVDRQRELGTFFDSLPTESEVTDILASISSIAEASKVEVKQAEYHLDDKNKHRLEYGLFFPVQGEYGNIRHFVFQVLAEHPAIALDQINFHRDKVNDTILKAEIRFSLFMQPKN